MLVTNLELTDAPARTGINTYVILYKERNNLITIAERRFVREVDCKNNTFMYAIPSVKELVSNPEYGKPEVRILTQLLTSYADKEEAVKQLQAYREKHPEDEIMLFESRIPDDFKYIKISNRSIHGSTALAIFDKIDL